MSLKIAAPDRHFYLHFTDSQRFLSVQVEKCRKGNEQKGEEETASLMYILFYSAVIPKAVYLVRACACVCDGARHSVSSGSHSVDPALYSPPTMGEAAVAARSSSVLILIGVVQIGQQTPTHTYTPTHTFVLLSF